MRAFLVQETHGDVRSSIETVAEPIGDVIVKIDYSALNFKDSLVLARDSKVRRRSPLIPGVDAAGVVLSCAGGTLQPGDRVAVHGGQLGTGENGGFAEYLAAPAGIVSKLPETLSTRRAMILGTAGYTAAASVLALEAHGLTPADGDVLVTGATGGVGSLAVTLLAQRGYSVVASTGSPHDAAWLHDRGARHVIGRDDIRDRPDRVLATPRWSGAVDCVGGQTLADIIAALKWGGAVAASGLVGSASLNTNVYAFITRNVSLLGIDSVDAPNSRRAEVWAALDAWTEGIDLEPLVDSEIGLEGIADAIERIGRGETRGRVLVNPWR